MWRNLSLLTRIISSEFIRLPHYPAGIRISLMGILICRSNRFYVLHPLRFALFNERRTLHYTNTFINLSQRWKNTTKNTSNDRIPVRQSLYPQKLLQRSSEWNGLIKFQIHLRIFNPSVKEVPIRSRWMPMKHRHSGRGVLKDLNHDRSSSTLVT